MEGAAALPANRAPTEEVIADEPTSGVGRAARADAEKSASPSTVPRSAADPPAIAVKKIAKTEKPASELTSVRKLTIPILTTSG